MIKGRRSYLCMSINGFMFNRRYPKEYEGVFRADAGTPLSAAEARDYLIGELAKGRKVIPMSAECGRPCKNADKGCPGFDFAGGGCGGFEVLIPESEL